MTDITLTADIIVDATLSEKDVVTFRRFWPVTNPYANKIKSMILILLVALFPVTLVYNFTSPAFVVVQNETVTVSLAPLFIHSLILFIPLYRDFFKFKRNYRRASLIESAKHHFEFCETSFRYTNTKTLSKMELHEKYANLVKVFETKEYLYLFDRHKFGLILSKSLISPENLDILRARLQNALGNRFVKVM